MPSFSIYEDVPVTTSVTYAPFSEEWLTRHVEPIIDPTLQIVDAHHHLWDLPRQRYMIEDILPDLRSGHDVTATVYVDCGSMYRRAGVPELRAVGEVEFANGVAAMAASGDYGATRICAGIVSFGSLHLGATCKPVLEAMLRAGGERFKGVRQASAWDPDLKVSRPVPERPAGLLLDSRFREGFACLAPLGLTFDAYLFQPQIPELTSLARAFPETPIVLDHLGGPLGVGRYAGRSDDMFAAWKSAMTELAKCSNVFVKLGGLGMKIAGFDFHERGTPASSEEIARAWRPHIETAIELFGANRCMFESNFPPDKGSCSYLVLWNVFKRIVAGATPTERENLFSRTAERFYRLAPA